MLMSFEEIFALIVAEWEAACAWDEDDFWALDSDMGDRS